MCVCGVEMVCVCGGGGNDEWESSNGELVYLCVYVCVFVCVYGSLVVLN